MESKELRDEDDKRSSNEQEEDEQINTAKTDEETSRTDEDPLKVFDKLNDESPKESPPSPPVRQLTEEEMQVQLEKSTKLKNEGNVHFKNEEYERSLELYTQAFEELRDCPEAKDKKSIILNNKAVCKFKLLERSSSSLDFKDEKVKADLEEIIKVLSESIRLNPNYLKPYLKRAELNYKFGEDKLDSSLEDYKKSLELVPTDNRKLVNEIKHEICKIEKEIEVRNEKLKQEMFAKLKDIGNLCLRPFGLSTDNIKLEQNENGSYSINLQQ